jgi:hypothetical protein
MSFLKAENIKLKEQVESLEQRLLNLAGTLVLFPSGIQGKENELSNRIATLIASATTELKIVAPYITQDFALLIQDRAKNGVKIDIILTDRRFWPEPHQKVYDSLKLTRNVSLINIPNVQFLLILKESEAILSSGPMDKVVLTKNVLVGTHIKDKIKINDLNNIFKEMLPSFMR